MNELSKTKWRNELINNKRKKSTHIYIDEIKEERNWGKKFEDGWDGWNFS